MVISEGMLRNLVMIGGLGQLALILGSVAIPRVMRWKEELSALPSPLFRQMFWVYSIYIWATNLCFGLLSTLAPAWLLQKTPFAAAVSGFIALYWISRFFIQIFYFDRSVVKTSFLFQWAEWALMGLFLFLAFTYSAATYFNLN